MSLMVTFVVVPASEHSSALNILNEGANVDLRSVDEHM